MKIEYSLHWEKQKRFRPEITDDLLELCIQNSEKLKDRNWEDTFNAIVRIPPSGRILKVVYKEIYKDESKTIKILTSYWLD
ncbi:hypothetical protein HYW75_01635 [Candidatus Pacearchaeota archaeon]|nr:hypothetical protein [Candidatus Pacearchaeota archaeon]